MFDNEEKEVSEILSLREAAAFLGLSEMRMRELVRTGKIPQAYKAKPDELSLKEVWHCPVAGLEEWQALKSERKTGSNGNGGTTFRVKVGDRKGYEALKAFCSANGFALEKGYKPATPEQQKKYRDQAKVRRIEDRKKALEAAKASKAAGK